MRAYLALNEPSPETDNGAEDLPGLPL
jgi:hypothetical protein